MTTNNNGIGHWITAAGTGAGAADAATSGNKQ